jgi:hypothetical protein
MSARVGDFAELRGVDADPVQVRPGDEMTVRLYWRAFGPADKNYTVFVHLLDENGQLIGKKDAPPLNGQAPTETWEAGEYVSDEYVFVINPSAPAGAATLELGMYDSATGARLPVIARAGDAPLDHLVVDGLQVE